MENIIILLLIAVVIALALPSSVKHLKRKNGCCGGEEYKVKAKKLSNVLYKKTFKVEGMTCQHCKNRVEEAVNDIEFVAGKVDLKSGELTVFYEKETDDNIIREKLERAGYKMIL